ncbi:hypothetical protein B9Z55_021543 [Caenorhabditis nigoni]|uniref:Uncharacterized protein n=1 Tax=Caenorhabditis nigoni TaxID=1611254 RepID=A0A2G5TSF8_9PELO|nr:hypothetical protein B9Z55_021543 [Caenorhabditis nigoni]
MGLTKMSIDLALTKHRKDSGITSSPLFSAPFTACTAVLLLFHKTTNYKIVDYKNYKFPTVSLPCVRRRHVLLLVRYDTGRCFDFGTFQQDTDALFYTSDHQFRVLDPTTIPSGTNVHVIVCPNMTRKVIRSA